MTSTETTSLLPQQNATRPPENNVGHHTGYASRFSSFIKAEGQSSYAKSFQWYFFGSFFNILLVFVPLSAMAHYLKWDVALRFSFSFLAIMPLAKVGVQFPLHARLTEAVNFNSFMLSSYLVIPQNNYPLGLDKLLLAS
jgi:hypothetical protein